jgi:hypothetical protein
MKKYTHGSINNFNEKERTINEFYMHVSRPFFIPLMIS